MVRLSRCSLWLQYHILLRGEERGSQARAQGSCHTLLLQAVAAEVKLCEALAAALQGLEEEEKVRFKAEQFKVKFKAIKAKAKQSRRSVK